MQHLCDSFRSPTSRFIKNSALAQGEKKSSFELVGRMCVFVCVRSRLLIDANGRFLACRAATSQLAAYLSLESNQN